MFLLIVGLALSLIACARDEDDVIRMGFVPMRDGDRLIDSVQPLTDLLSKELGLKVEGFTASNYVGVVEGLGSGTVDFGFMPPFAYLLANQESNAQVILSSIKSDGQAKYRAQFLVAKDSNIKEFSDIKGKTVAFVDPSSTSGYLFPGAHLKEVGIDLEKDIEYLYSGGHDKSLQLLLNGDVDVAVTFVDTRLRYADEFPQAMEETEVLGYTDYIPSISVVVSGKTEDKLRNDIKNALLKIADDPEGGALLENLFDMYGFVETDDSEFEIIRSTAELMDVDLKSGD